MTEPTETLTDETTEPDRRLDHDDPETTDGLEVEDLVVEDLLVEEVSIDGMCGVY